MLGVMSQRQAGDTIIEVLFAVSIFSLVAVGAISIMNQGINTAQRALEITQVRQQIDAQAEALRFAHHTYVMSLGGTVNDTEWAKIKSRAATQVSEFGSNGAISTCDPVPRGAFIMNARTGAVSSSVEPISISPTASDVPPPPFSQVTYRPSEAGRPEEVSRADGIWIEAVRKAGEGGGVASYYDFHIRACWENPGTGPAITLGTIVRLYEPAV